MNLSFRPLLIALAWLASTTLAGAACQCGDACPCNAPCACAAGAETDAAPVDKGHPLKGVVQTVMAERSALLVAHEEIPGFMKAMTMMFQVDPEWLPKVKEGDSLTGTMKRSKSGSWLLEEIQIIKE